MSHLNLPLVSTDTPISWTSLAISYTPDKATLALVLGGVLGQVEMAPGLCHSASVTQDMDTQSQLGKQSSSFTMTDVCLASDSKPVVVGGASLPDGSLASLVSGVSGSGTLGISSLPVQVGSVLSPRAVSFCPDDIGARDTSPSTASTSSCIGAFFPSLQPGVYKAHSDIATLDQAVSALVLVTPDRVAFDQADVANAQVAVFGGLSPDHMASLLSTLPPTLPGSGAPVSCVHVLEGVLATVCADGQACLQLEDVSYKAGSYSFQYQQASASQGVSAPLSGEDTDTDTATGACLPCDVSPRSISTQNVARVSYACPTSLDRMTVSNTDGSQLTLDQPSMAAGYVLDTSSLASGTLVSLDALPWATGVTLTGTQGVTSTQGIIYPVTLLAGDQAVLSAPALGPGSVHILQAEDPARHRPDGSDTGDCRIEYDLTLVGTGVTFPGSMAVAGIASAAVASPTQTQTAPALSLVGTGPLSIGLTPSVHSGSVHSMHSHHGDTALGQRDTALGRSSTSPSAAAFEVCVCAGCDVSVLSASDASGVTLTVDTHTDTHTDTDTHTAQSGGTVTVHQLTVVATGLTILSASNVQVSNSDSGVGATLFHYLASDDMLTLSHPLCLDALSLVSTSVAVTADIDASSITTRGLTDFDISASLSLSAKAVTASASASDSIGVAYGAAGQDPSADPLATPLLSVDAGRVTCTAASVSSGAVDGDPTPNVISAVGYGARMGPGAPPPTSSTIRSSAAPSNSPTLSLAGASHAGRGSANCVTPQPDNPDDDDDARRVGGVYNGKNSGGGDDDDDLGDSPAAVYGTQDVPLAGSGGGYGPGGGWVSISASHLVLDCALDMSSGVTDSVSDADCDTGSGGGGSGGSVYLDVAHLSGSGSIDVSGSDGLGSGGGGGGGYLVLTESMTTLSGSIGINLAGGRQGDCAPDVSSYSSANLNLNRPPSPVGTFNQDTHDHSDMVYAEDGLLLNAGSVCVFGLVEGTTLKCAFGMGGLSEMELLCLVCLVLLLLGGGGYLLYSRIRKSRTGGDDAPGEDTPLLRSFHRDGILDITDLGTGGGQPCMYQGTQGNSILASRLMEESSYLEGTGSHNALGSLGDELGGGSGFNASRILVS
ncbi:hypothetical protein KIPB_008752, partial [Kipferlia bialata]|eukprot:g8752.t1